MARSAKRQIEGDETVHHVSERAKRERPKPKMQPPLTPMIDVTFQLLLFFLLTMTFRQAEGIIPGSLPRQGAVGQETEVPLEKITISVRPQGDAALFEVGGIEVGTSSPEQLYQQLVGKREAIGSTKPPVEIRPSGDVAWAHVVNAYNQALRAKFENIGFAAAG